MVRDPRNTKIDPGSLPGPPETPRGPPRAPNHSKSLVGIHLASILVTIFDNIDQLLTKDLAVCLLLCRSGGLSVRRSVGLSVCRSVGLSVCLSVGLSVPRSVGMWVCRFVGQGV